MYNNLYFCIIGGISWMKYINLQSFAATHNYFVIIQIKTKKEYNFLYIRQILLKNKNKFVL